MKIGQIKIKKITILVAVIFYFSFCGCKEQSKEDINSSSVGSIVEDNKTENNESVYSPLESFDDEEEESKPQQTINENSSDSSYKDNSSKPLKEEAKEETPKEENQESTEKEISKEESSKPKEDGKITLPVDKWK